MGDLKQVIHLGEGYTSLEQLAQDVEFWDATSSASVARCPRYAQYWAKGLRSSGVSWPLVAGRSLHAALDIYYTLQDADLALEHLRHEWSMVCTGKRPPGSQFSHLNQGHMEVVFKNYVDWSRKHDVFRPIRVLVDDLKMDNVLAAIMTVGPGGEVVLGECKLVMKFQLVHEGKPIELVYSGKPDLPIFSGGTLQILDHKSTNAYLSDWYFSSYKFSNQLRGYCAMTSELLGQRVDSALINGIYIGDKAAGSAFKGTRFTRFGPLSYRKSHLDEALLNQYFWRKTLDYHAQQGYWPQNAGRACQGCGFAELCKTTPIMRQAVEKQEFAVDDRSFLDL